MSRRVYGWDQNPLADRHPFRCSNSSAAYAIENGIAFEVIDGDGRAAIQLAEPTPFEQSLRAAARDESLCSAKAVLQFVRTHCTGDKLHYEIPHAGDRSLYARHRRRLVHVSGRSIFDFRYQCARTA